MFADAVEKINRRGKPETRDFIVTDNAVYLIAKEIKKKIVCFTTPHILFVAFLYLLFFKVTYKIMRRTPLREIRALSMSTLAGIFIVIFIVLVCVTHLLYR